MRFTVLQIALSFALTAPALAADPPAKPADNKGAAAAPATDASKGGMKGDPKNDAETVAMLCALNEHEVVAGTIAEQKKVTGPVLDFAKMMQREHGQNLIDTHMVAGKAKVAPAADSPAVLEMKKKHAADTAALVQNDGDAFSKAFVEAMVKGHTEALALLDARLAGAQNADLKKHLTSTRGHIAMHLDAAKKLQTSSTTTTSTAAPKK